jgi:DNA-binding transcriptional ArsR family regulator
METLHPTLWRTCRTLANGRRLACLKAVLAQPNCTVEELAETTGMPNDQASLCLRALQARGLIQSERYSRWVRYSPLPDRSVPAAAPILDAIRRAFFDERMADPEILFALTAFTHPRRLAILRSLQFNGPQPADKLSIATQVSPPALWRHLVKLRRRHLVDQTQDGWQLAPRPSPLAQTMLTLIACGQV